MKTVGCFQVKYIMDMHTLPLLIGARELLGFENSEKLKIPAGL